MPAGLIIQIESTCETCTEPLHCLGQIGLFCLQQKVVVTVHQNIGVDLDVKTIVQLFQ